MDVHLFTQKEWAQKLGVSERTIRRFKNQKGYQLSAKTLKRAGKAISREDAKVKRLIDSGFAIKMRTTTIKGKRKRVPDKVKGIKIPKSRVLQIPTVYPSKSGESQTLQFDVHGWSAEQKIELIESAHSEKRYGSWHARVMVPPGVGRSGRKGEGEIVDDEPDEEIDEETGEVITIQPKPEFYMIGPFSLTGNRPKIRSEINYHEDAGRVIVEISLVEKVK